MTDAVFKACTKCRKSLPISAFFRSEKHRCKACHTARMKELRLTNPDVRARDRERAQRLGRKEYINERSKLWRKKNPLGYKAHYILNNALRAGEVKKLPCAMCGDTKQVHAHHHDYTKPLDVKWLCAKCHKRLHVNFPEAIGASV
jgi:hypothetical protein